MMFVKNRHTKSTRVDNASFGTDGSVVKTRKNPRGVEKYAPVVTLTPDTRFLAQMYEKRGAEIDEILSMRRNADVGYNNSFYDMGLVRWISKWIEYQPSSSRRAMMLRLCELWIPAMEFARQALPLQGDPYVQPLNEAEIASFGGAFSIEAPFLAIYQRTACIFFSIVHACVKTDESLLNENVQDILNARIFTLNSLIDVQTKTFESACLKSNFDPRDPEQVLSVLTIAESIQTSEFDTGEGLSQQTDTQRDIQRFKLLIEALLEKTTSKDDNAVQFHFWALNKFAKKFIVSDKASPLDDINKKLEDLNVFLNFNIKTTEFKEEARELGSAVLANLDYIRVWAYYVGAVWMEEDLEKTFHSRGDAVSWLIQEVSDISESAENNAQKALDACQAIFTDIRPLADSIYPFLPFDIRLIERFARTGRSVKEMAYLLNCSERVIRHVITEDLGLELTDKGTLPTSEIRRYLKKTPQEVERIAQVYQATQGNMAEVRKAFKYKITVADFDHFRQVFGIADVDSPTLLDAFAHLKWGNSTEEYNTIAADFLRVPTYEVIANIKRGKYGPMPSGRTISYRVFRNLMERYCPSINLEEYARLKPRRDWRYDIDLRAPK